MEKPQIGQILIAEGAVSEAVLARALGYQRATRQMFRLGSILFNWDLLGEDKLLAALSKLHHCPPATWAEISQATPEALKTFSAAYAVRLGAFPYAIDSKGLRVAFSNPSDLAAIDEVSSVSRKRLVPAVATEAALVLAFHRFYGRPVPPPFREVVQKFDRARVAPASPRATRPVPVASAVTASRAVSRELSLPTATMPETQAPPAAAEPPASSSLDRVSPAPAASAASRKAEPPHARTPPAGEPVEARNRARIAVSVVETLLATFPRVLVLGVGKTALSGWTGRGPGLTPEISASIRVPMTENTVLPEVARTGTPHFGPLAPERLSLALKGMLDRQAPVCAALPIRVLGSVAAILYADRLGEPMSEEDLPVLSDAAETAAKLLSKFLLPDGGNP